MQVYWRPVDNMAYTTESAQALLNKVAALFSALPAHLQAALTLKSLKSSAVLGAIVVLAVRFALSRSRKKARRIADFAHIAWRVRDSKSGSPVEYDIVIVGGGRCVGTARIVLVSTSSAYNEGTAGCVLASRLSENPKLRVLLIEAGGR